MNLRLILCAFGLHGWCMYCCRASDAERDTQRECSECGTTRYRRDQKSPWQSWDEFFKMRDH